MKIFRAILPLYKRLIKDSSRGKGYGKNKDTIYEILSLAISSYFWDNPSEKNLFAGLKRSA